MTSRERDRISAARQSSAKQAKELCVELTDLLRKKDPWNQDVVFARENLRRHCLALIFQPVASSDVTTESQAQARRRLYGLNVLFLTTSYNIIQNFRQRLNALDKLAASNSNPRSSNSSKRRPEAAGDRGSGGSSTAVQRRKLLQSFRDFLGKEEAYWRDLLIRIVGVFDVEEARTPLRLLQLGLGDWEADPDFKASKEIHDQAVLLCHKVLICFGDIARYKELYAEGSKKSNNVSTPKPRGGKLAPAAIAQANEKREGSWAKAFEAYHQARLLVPDDGNPSNQLAVLAGYQHDTLSSIYHYYRALCVKRAFNTAKDNIAATFVKVLKSWEADEQLKTDRKTTRTGSYKDVDTEAVERSPASDPSNLLEDFKKQFVALHAMLFQGSNLNSLPTQFTRVTQLFSGAVIKRVLPSDVIVKSIVTAMSAWWYARISRRMSNKSDSAPKNVNIDPASLESSALLHTLALIAELMSIAVTESRGVELHEALQRPPTAAQSERSMLLAQSITAVLRRALPALRIASMWLLSNADYLAKFDTTSADFKTGDPSVAPEVCSAIRGFWTSYASFANSLASAFPLQLLPVTAGDFMLEEDIDMLGFAPLRRRMKDASVGSAAKNVSAALAAAANSSANLHPNEEQVLRLGDLLSDASLLAQSESCPLVIERGYFVIRSKRLNPASQPWSPVKAGAPATVASPPWESEDDELEEEENYDEGIDLSEGEDNLSEHLTTEDDVLDLAMRVATGNTGADELEDDEEEDDEEILYPSRILQPAQTRLPAKEVSPVMQQPVAAPLPVQVSNPAGVSRTASDLLLQVLQGNSMDLRTSPTMDAASAVTQPTAAAPFALKQSPPVAPGSIGSQSIWSSPLTGPTSGTPSHHRLGSGSSPLGAIGSARPGSSSASGAEALFNSMPNQSQAQANVRSSPGSNMYAFDASKNMPFGPGASGAVPAGIQGQGDIWNPPSPRRNVQVTPQPSNLNPAQRAFGKQYG